MSLTGVTVQKCLIWVKIGDFFVPCDLEIWCMTLKNNRAPLLCYIKLCASFHCHMLIHTGVTGRKQLNWVVTSVTLTIDLWPWPFAWISLFSMAIALENFMMIQWPEHCQKGVTDGQTDGLNHSYSCLVTAKIDCKIWNRRALFLRLY